MKKKLNCPYCGEKLKLVLFGNSELPIYRFICNNCGEFESEFISEREPRNPDRIPIILNKLEKLWEQSPDLRLAQLLTILCDNKKDIFYIEDKDLEKSIDKKLEEKTNEKE